MAEVAAVSDVTPAAWVPEEIIGRNSDDAKGPGLPEAISVYREHRDLGDRMESSETSHYVADLSAAEVSRDEIGPTSAGSGPLRTVTAWTFDENLSQVRTGGATQAFAMPRNLAISVLCLVGFTSIASGLCWMALNHQREFQILGLQLSPSRRRR